MYLRDWDLLEFSLGMEEWQVLVVFFFFFPAYPPLLRCSDFFCLFFFFFHLLLLSWNLPAQQPTEVSSPVDMMKPVPLQSSSLPINSHLQLAVDTIQSSSLDHQSRQIHLTGSRARPGRCPWPALVSSWRGAHTRSQSYNRVHATLWARPFS